MNDQHQGAGVVVETDDALQTMKKDPTYEKNEIDNLLGHRRDFDRHKRDADDHLATLVSDINVTVDDEIEKAVAKEKLDAQLIDEEADRKIREINDRRETLKSLNRKNGEKRRKLLEDHRQKLIADVTCVGTKCTEGIKAIEEEIESVSRAFVDDKAADRVESVVANDKDNVTDYTTSLDARIGEVANNVRNLKRIEIFPKTIGNRIFSSTTTRIDGYLGKWTFSSAVKLPDEVKSYTLFDCLGETEIVVRGFNDDSVHILNLASGKTRTVNMVEPSARDKKYVVSCASLHNGNIVCGKSQKRRCFGKTLDGCVTLYDRRWSPIRDIAIPRNTSTMSTAVYVHVDDEGKIIAAERDQSNIYVVDQENGAVIETITMSGWNVQERVHALPSGSFISRVSSNFYGSTDVAIIDRSGTVTRIIRDIVHYRFTVDVLTGSVYIAYEDGKSPCGDTSVDQVDIDGVVQSERIVTFPQSLDCSWHGACRISPSGRLICSNGGEVFIYEKSFDWIS